MSDKSIDKKIRQVIRGRSVRSAPPKLDETSKKMGDFIRGRPDESESLEEAAALAAAKQGTLEEAVGLTEEKAEELGLVEGDITPSGKVYRKEKGK